MTRKDNYTPLQSVQFMFLAYFLIASKRSTLRQTLGKQSLIPLAVSSGKGGGRLFWAFLRAGRSGDIFNYKWKRLLTKGGEGASALRDSGGEGSTEVHCLSNWDVVENDELGSATEG